MALQYTDSQRMELRSTVNLAGEVVARLWPMRTFISRNPLQGLEHLDFDEAVDRGERLFGGSGYLSSDLHREAFRNGRIHSRHLEEVLQPLSSDQHLHFGDRRIHHLDVLTAAMAQGIQIRLDGVSQSETKDRQEDREQLERVARWLTVLASQGDLDESEERIEETIPGPPHDETMAMWCDRTLGTEVNDRINRHMIKWCAAFCDEGEAAWPMPHRERTFFRAWKAAAPYDLGLAWQGIQASAEKIRALPDRPEDALLQSLEMLNVKPAAWQEYLSLHIAALPGWAGFIKWRSEQTAYPWQEAYRIDLIQYLAVRLFYEREFAAASCRKALGCGGDVQTVHAYAERYPHALWARRALVAGRLPKGAASEAARLRWWGQRSGAGAWEQFGRRWYGKLQLMREAERRLEEARALIRLAAVLGMDPALITETAQSELSMLLGWLRSLSPRLQALKWLEACERGHQYESLRKLTSSPAGRTDGSAGQPVRARPLAQFVFCIDVRSEVFRRHLEQRGGYETFGFAGFFGVPVIYRSLDESPDAELCPVLIKPKHVVREVPRTYQGGAAERRRSMAALAKLGQGLLHDLKHNVITPYVMVEAIGWFFAWPLLGRTLFPRWYHRMTVRAKRAIMPPVSTTMTVDKLTTDEAYEMIAAEQRMRIMRWLRVRYPAQSSALSPGVLEGIRQQVLRMDEGLEGEAKALQGIVETGNLASLEDLRRECRLTARDTSARVNHLTRTGFTEKEQAYYVETALRLMGLTSSFGRLVFMCAHGSSSQNNPYESALDCGACGGSQGLPNARAFATIANRPKVRELLAQRGIAIPSDTHFIAALHDTTTDEVSVADLEDVPSTHRKELAQVLEDVAAAGDDATAERHTSLTVSGPAESAAKAARAVRQRSVDWSQVRPEWGLARNSLFIVARRELTRGTDLEGRSFLHSYEHGSDEDGKLLEFIMTAPLIVAQWINMEYYFSTVAPEIYGSGSKVYHNVTGRIGVMAGNHSDLRMGLPVQSLMAGRRPYHDPLRLTAIIEAPRERITAIIERQPLVERLVRNRWITLIALDPAERRFYRLAAGANWTLMREEADRSLEPVGVWT